jgi:hypothetical protein
VDTKESWEAGLAWLKAQEQSAVLEVSTLVEANREAERLLGPTSLKLAELTLKPFKDLYNHPTTKP